MHLADLNADGKAMSKSQLCRILEIPRSTAYYKPRSKRRNDEVDEKLCKLIIELAKLNPTYGIRRIWALLRHQHGLVVNKKKVARIMRIKQLTMKKKSTGSRPRVIRSRSVAPEPDMRWSTDVALVHCGHKDGWCSFVPVLDCCTREVLGWELQDNGRAKTAERALEKALIYRYGRLKSTNGILLRHDNGLVFNSRLYRSTANLFGFRQEFITPYTPEENGLVERFIRSFKEECVWQFRFNSLEEARVIIGIWIDKYNTSRPHQALKYMTPVQFMSSFVSKISV